jgi:predicted O-methyltransferase YrrM
VGAQDGRSWRSLGRRLFRLLFVANLAAGWLIVRHGWRASAAYLHEVWTLYLWPRLVPIWAEESLPEVRPDQYFPGADWIRAEILHPLQRPGGVRTEELAILATVVRFLGSRRIVEIGTCEGRTTLNLAHSAPKDAVIITLDLPPEAPSPSSPVSSRDYRQMGFDEPGGLLTGAASDRIERIRADSTRFDWAPYECSIDFVFIDGAHDYASVRADTENALRILRPGGVIFWHDYRVPEMEGVTRWLHELARDRPVVWLKGTALACLRLPDGSTGEGGAERSV